MCIKARIGLGDSYIVAQHSEVDIRSEAGIEHLAMLHVGKTVAEHSHAHCGGMESAQEVKGTVDSGFLLREKIEIKRVETL